MISFKIKEDQTLLESQEDHVVLLLQAVPLATGVSRADVKSESFLVAVTIHYVKKGKEEHASGLKNI